MKTRSIAERDSGVARAASKSSSSGKLFGAVGRLLSRLADDCWRSMQLVVFFVVAASTFAMPPTASSTASAALAMIESTITAAHNSVIEMIAFAPDFLGSRTDPTSTQPISGK